MSADAHSETVSHVISALREEHLRRGISEQKLAGLAKMSRGGNRHIEAEEVQPTLYTLLKISEALDLDFLELLASARGDVSKKRPSSKTPLR